GFSTTKVPSPVIEICEPSAASADATPPGFTVSGLKLEMLMMSHLAVWARTSAAAARENSPTTKMRGYTLLRSMVWSLLCCSSQPWQGITLNGAPSNYDGTGPRGLTVCRGNSV